MENFREFKVIFKGKELFKNDPDVLKTSSYLMIAKKTKSTEHPLINKAKK